MMPKLPDAQGHFGRFGSRFVPETLMAPLEELAAAYAEARRDRAFRAELRHLLTTYAGRPTPLTEARPKGDQSSLELKDFTPEPLHPVEFYKEYPIHMSIVGAYHDLGLFLDRISKYSRIINISNVNISNNPGGGDKTIRSEFTATTFIYNEQADKVDAAGGA